MHRNIEFVGREVSAGAAPENEQENKEMMVAEAEMSHREASLLPNHGSRCVYCDQNCR